MAREKATYGLSSEAQELLESVRGATPPSSEQLDRVHESVRAAVAPQGVPPTAPLTGLSPAAKATIIMAGFAAIAVVGTMLISVEDSQRDSSAASAAEENPAGAPAEQSQISNSEPGETVESLLMSPSESEPMVTPVSSVDVDSQETVEPEAVARVPRSQRRARAHRPNVSAPALQPPPTRSESEREARLRTLAEETALLRRAQNALRRRDPRAALAALQEHAERYPDGTLRGDREAARLIAQCRLAPSSATRERASAFLARNRRSPYAARIQAACSISGDSREKKFNFRDGSDDPEALRR